MECDDGSGISSRLHCGREDGVMGPLAARRSRRLGGRLAIRVEMLRPTGRIDVIDGDSVGFEGAAYRLVGNRYAGPWAISRAVTTSAAALKRPQSDCAPSLPAAMPG